MAKNSTNIICHFVLQTILAVIVCASLAYGEGKKTADLLTHDERLWLTNNQSRITLAVETGFPPFVFLDTKNQPAGLAHDYLLLLESKLGAHFQQKRFAALGEVLEKARKGEVQIVNAVMKTPERSAYLDFTPSLISVPNVIIVHKDRSGQMQETDLPGLKVSMVKHYAVTDYLTQKIGNLNTELVPDELTGLLNVSFGRSDAAVIDLATASYLISQKKITNLRVAGETTFHMNLAMGTSKAEPFLYAILQKGLAAINEAEREGIQNRWMGGLKQNIFSDRRFRIAAGGGLTILFALIAGSIVWNRTLRNEVAKRTRELDNVNEELRLTTAHIEVELAERQAAQESLQEQATILEEEIEERRRAEEALQTNREDLIESQRIAHVGSWRLDIASNQVVWSEELYKMYGFDPTIPPPEYTVHQKLFTPESWDRLSTALSSTTETGIPYELELETVREDGSRGWMWVHGESVCDASGVTVGLRGATQDITERKEAEQKIKRLTTMLSESQHIAQVGGWEVDLVDKTLYWTDETFRLHDTSPAEYTPTLESAIKFYAPESVPIITSAVNEAIEGKQNFNLELNLITAKGRPIKVHTTCKTVQENGKTTKIMGAFRDITEQKHLEEQLRQSQKMEAIGQLAGGVAHDFNNILTVIMGYANMLERGAPLDEHQKEATTQIFNSSERAAQLTRGLLAFSRKQVLTVRKENLNDIVHHIQKFLVRVIGEDIQLKLIANELHLPVNLDSGQIEQVLMNLVTNARDAMQKGGTLTIETGLQEIEAAIGNPAGPIAPGRYACIAVSDTGSGMDEETCSRIFEPFFTTKEVGKGTGLGMAIVYGIVQQHNGFINVYSEPGVGTTFRIHLPLVEGEQSDQSEKKELAAPQGGTETILLAEDDASVRKLVTTVLTQFGYNVIPAEDGQDAVDKFSANIDMISLLLMDMIMPKKNGKEAYDEICRIKPGVKILYSSGYTADFIQNRGVDEAGIELIMKPVQPMELLRKVREVLDR